MNLRHFTCRYLAIVCLATGYAAGQQAIINMPSADITPRGSAFMMHETQWRPWGAGRYWYGTNFFAYGLGRNTELAVTSYNTGTPAVPNQALGVGFKTAMPLADSPREPKLTVGAMGLASFRGQGVGHFTYSHYSFRAPHTNTRITLGGWWGSRQLFRYNTANVLAGVEHPLNKKVILLGEWFAGAHDLGFAIPGVLYHPTPRQFIVVGYKFANDPRNGDNGLVLEYGFYFGGVD